MRNIILVLWIFFAILQYQLWFGRHGIIQLVTTKTNIEKQIKENKRISLRNKRLSDQVVNLQKNSAQEIEIHARQDLGMIKPSETFYFIPSAKKGLVPL